MLDTWQRLNAVAGRGPANARRFDEVSPRELGIHAAITSGDTLDDELPTYVSRDFDGQLQQEIANAADQENGGCFVVLLGGSSTGKTRSLYEAIYVAVPNWWLVQPTETREILDLYDSPSSKTILWLDELHRFLGTDPPLTKAVVLGLVRAGTVVVGTIWPLIRRIVEECALWGVSSIVLDPNNDLARLGDAWPQTPPQWNGDDVAKAANYLEQTDVVVWTPRREAGRPLSFQPLPDFRGVLDDPDEFNEAVEAAVASLAPRAMLAGRATKTHLGLAVLRKAVEHYGQRGGTHLRGLIDTLADFRTGSSTLMKHRKSPPGWPKRSPRPWSTTHCSVERERRWIPACS